MTIHQKIMGCLVGAAAGDALGAATEMRTHEQIIEYFNGQVRDFVRPPNDTFARGAHAGEVTDDFSLAYSTILTILNHKGCIDQTVAKESLIHWGKTPYFEKYAGPTTRIAIAEFLGLPIETRHTFLVNDNSKSTNGAAMKMAPIALFAHGDLDRAINMAVEIAMVSHDNQLSLSGACAIAAATAQAMQVDATLDRVLKAGLYGAIEGERIGKKKAKTLAGASVAKRIEWACELAKRPGETQERITLIHDLIGSGLAANEAVPCVFGLLGILGDQPLEAVLAAVNIGNDTDTVATMVGGIMGALHGIDAFPKHYLATLNLMNHFDLMAMAKQIEEMVYGS